MSRVLERIWAVLTELPETSRACLAKAAILALTGIAFAVPGLLLHLRAQATGGLPARLAVAVAVLMIGGGIVLLLQSLLCGLGGLQLMRQRKK